MSKKNHRINELYNPNLTSSQKAQARSVILSKSKDPILQMLTNHELACLYNRIWDAMAYRGYDMSWTIDTEVIHETSPAHCALNAINNEARRRKLF